MMTKQAQPLLDMLLTITDAIKRVTVVPDIRFIEHAAAITLQVAAQDQGRFIGKNGSVIWALQVLCIFAGKTHLNCPVELRLLEPAVEAPRDRMPFRPNPKWDRQMIGRLVDSILETCLMKLKPAWVIEETDTMKAVVHIKIEEYLRAVLSERIQPLDMPSFEDSLQTVIHAAGMAQGANITTEVTWA